MATADDRQLLIENEVLNDESNKNAQGSQPPTYSNSQPSNNAYNEQTANLQPTAPVDFTQPLLAGSQQQRGSPPPSYTDAVGNNPQSQTHYQGQIYPGQGQHVLQGQYQSVLQLPNPSIQEHRPQDIRRPQQQAPQRNYGSVTAVRPARVVQRGGSQNDNRQPTREQQLAYIVNRWQDLEAIEHERQQLRKCRLICACVWLVLGAILIIVILLITHFSQSCDDGCYNNGDGVCVCD